MREGSDPGMADLSGCSGGEGHVVEAGGGNAATPAAPVMLTASASFKGEGKAGPALRRRPSIKPSLEVEEFINMLHGSDPVRVELSRLENEVRGGNAVRSVSFLIFSCFLPFGALRCLVFADKDRELGEAQAEIRALRLSERARERAVEEVISPFLFGYLSWQLLLFLFFFLNLIVDFYDFKCRFN